MKYQRLKASGELGGATGTDAALNAKSNTGNNKFCNHCKKKGHTEATCWVKDPSKKPNGGKGGNKNRITGNCWYCEKPGHRAQECRKKKADADAKTRQESANAGKEELEILMVSNGAPSSIGKDVLLGDFGCFSTHDV